MGMGRLVNGGIRMAESEFFKTGLHRREKSDDVITITGINHGYKYEVVQSRSNDGGGLKDGKILSIMLTSIYSDDGKPTVHYDGGWQTKPSKNRDANALYSALVRKYN